MKIALCLLVLSAVAAGSVKTFLSQEQALKHAFGEKVTTTKQTHYWTKEQRAHLAELVGVDKASDVMGFHTAFNAVAVNGNPSNTNTVWFDKRMVRSKAQQIMLIVDDQGVIQELVVCAFDEPIKYKPSDKWYAQFKGLKLDDELQLKRKIHGVSGATLTARATTNAARELLAADQVTREQATAKKPPFRK